MYYTLSVNRLWKSISIARKFITRILNDEKIALELTLTPHQRSLKNVHPEFISRNTHRLPKGLSESEAKRSNERKREKFLPNVFRSDSKNTKKYSWLTEIEVEVSEERQQPVVGTNRHVPMKLYDSPWGNGSYTHPDKEIRDKYSVFSS